MSRAKTFTYEGETGSSAHLADLFGVTAATIRRKGSIVKESNPDIEVDGLTLETSREELLIIRSSGDDLTIAECNAFLQIQNIRNKRLN